MISSNFNIRHLSNNLILENGGPAYSIPKLCLGLKKLGNNIEINSIKNKSGNPQTIFPYKLFEISKYFKKIGLSKKLINNLVNDIKKVKIDLIHSHELWTLPSLIPFFTNKIYQVPWIISPRGTLTKYSLSSGSFLKKIYWPLLQNPSLKSSLAFHATSESEYLDIRRLGFRQPVAVIPNGIDIPSSISNIDKKIVLYFGRIHPEKGLENLLNAWAKINEKINRHNWYLKLVGPDINYLPQLKNLINQKKIKNVLFEGSKFGIEKEKLFLDSSIFVLPSFSENFGISVAEALSYSIPVIANFGSPWKGINEKNCGWWIDLDVETLSKTLEIAIETSREELIRKGSRGRKWMICKFSWFDVANKMNLFYDYLINQTSKPFFVITD